jgi:hypothetical protein
LKSAQSISWIAKQHDAPHQLSSRAQIPDFTIRNLAPYTSVYGDLFPFLRYSAGVRRDQISLDNVNRIMPASSYTLSSGITSPRGTLNLHVPGSTSLPTLTLSYGRAFHTNDPRTRMGSGKTEPFSSSRAYELAIESCALSSGPAIARRDFVRWFREGGASHC